MNEVARQRLDELKQETETLYYAIGCGVIDEERVAVGLAGAKKGLIWPSPEDPLFDNKQPHRSLDGRALFFGIRPEVVDAAFMEARRAGLDEAGADPDAVIKQQFSGDRLPDRRSMYSGPKGKKCSRWRDNPTQIIQVHNLARNLNLRATSGYLGYQ